MEFQGALIHTQWKSIKFSINHTLIKLNLMRPIVNFLFMGVIAGLCFAGCTPKTNPNDTPVVKTTSGSTLNELMKTYYGVKDMTLEQAKDSLAKEYGDKTDQYIELFAKAYPDYTPQDLLSIDKNFRPYTIRTADARAKESTAPLYVYFLAWKSQVDNASKGSFHGLDIPLAFNNVDLRPDWTGNTEEAWQLADKMSDAWLNFVKTGNPNVEGVLPTWEPYTAENGATMYFDKECRIVNNHDRELMQFIKPVE
jgi:para-nitrobenzyl esterase